MQSPNHQPPQLQQKAVPRKEHNNRSPPDGVDSLEKLSAGVMGGPSGHGGMPQTMQGAANGQGGGGEPFSSLDELRGHASRIEASILTVDAEIIVLVNTAGVISEADQQRMNDLRVERPLRVRVLKKVLHAVTELTRAGAINLTMSNVQQSAGTNLYVIASLRNTVR